MKYLKIQPFLTEEESSYYLTEALKPDGFFAHKSTKSGRSTYLNFKPIEFKGLERCALAMVEPNDTVDWHTDGTRDTVIIHPLSDNYAPCTTLDGEVSGPIILNVREKHAVFNNDQIRVSLQIFCPMKFSPNIEDYQFILPVKLRG